MSDGGLAMIRAAFALALIGSLAVSPGVAQQNSPIGLELVVEGLTHPVFVTHSDDGSGRLFVVEQAGRILVLENGGLRADPFLDISGRVRSGGERGLLGLAFHPQFAANGRYFTHHTRLRDGASVITEFRVSADPNRSRLVGRRLLLVPQPFSNHNGGMIAFGPDGFLYIALGDGGSGGDPGNRAQNPDSRLGKILRIDIDGARPYAIPHDNPFASGGGRREIYALGLRNPWRFSFDRQSGRLLAGDVGQNRIEEIDEVRAGGNYGWRVLEGTLCYQPRPGCDRTGFEPPLTQYRHIRGRCSVTGGYVYRGQAIPALSGTYLFGDYCSGEIFGLRADRRRVLLNSGLRIASFGEDEAGEVYVVDRRGGAIYRLMPAGP